MDRMDDMDRMDGMDVMDGMYDADTDPTIRICLNCPAANCRGSCYRINRILAGYSDPGPGSEVDGRVNGDIADAKALAEKWGKTLNRIYALARERNMSLADIDRYYTDRAERKAFISEMRGYAADISRVYGLLRDGKTFDEIRAMYRNRQREVA